MQDRYMCYGADGMKVNPAQLKDFLLEFNYLEMSHWNIIAFKKIKWQVSETVCKFYQCSKELYSKISYTIIAVIEKEWLIGGQILHNCTSKKSWCNACCPHEESLCCLVIGSLGITVVQLNHVA
ncbi:hypothetical protein SUGI_0875490 [Cryptomeria japonica]|nr:hypothetical protein SUGI_0875490 [Cryptomeria japonica]